MKKIRFIVLVLVLTVLTVGCATQDTIKTPNNLSLRPELVELFDDKDVQVAIVDYVNELVIAYNSRNNGIPEVSDKGKNSYKILSDYIDKQRDGVFTVSSAERGLRIKRIKKSLEIQEIAVLIATLKLDEVATMTLETTKKGADIKTVHERLDDTKALEIKTKTENLLKSYFK